jgi:2,3-bisphosphoglycerate-dependent phosphoglycerate mutase
MNIDPALYQKYSKEKIDEAVKYLSYKGVVEELPKNESDTKPTMYIFRHGQSMDNVNFIFSGWRDPGLTEEGKKQALILAEKLKDKKIGMLIASTQQRALETMKIAMSLNENAKNLEIHTDERIRERSYGDYQGKSKLEIQLEDPEMLKRIRRSFDIAPTNGESLKTVCERVKNFCDEIIPLMKDHNINVAVSCHGNSIRGFRKYFENLSEEQVVSMETPLGQDYAAYVIE